MLGEQFDAITAGKVYEQEPVMHYFDDSTEINVNNTNDRMFSELFGVEADWFPDRDQE